MTKFKAKDASYQPFITEGPVIYKFTSNLPPSGKRRKNIDLFLWLTIVISGNL